MLRPTGTMLDCDVLLFRNADDPSHAFTGNIAVAQYRYSIARENYKKDREIASGRYTDVLVKEDGRWLFLAWAGGDDPKK